MAVASNSRTQGRQGDYAPEPSLGYIVRLYQKNKPKKRRRRRKDLF